jgi:hypothetical protein
MMPSFTGITLVVIAVLIAVTASTIELEFSMYFEISSLICFQCLRIDCPPAPLPASNFQIDRFWTNALVAARHANCFAFNYQANIIEIAEDFVFYVQKFSPFINICCACGNKKADKLGLGNKSE